MYRFLLGSVDNCLKNLRPVACPRDPWIPRINRGTWEFGDKMSTDPSGCADISLA